MNNQKPLATQKENSELNAMAMHVIYFLQMFEALGNEI